MDTTEIALATYEPIGYQHARQTIIRISEPIPAFTGSTWQKDYADFYALQASVLAQTLASALPGGTFDRLIGELILKRASLLKNQNPF